MRTAKTLIKLADDQADLSFRLAHRSFCRFCRAAAHMCREHRKCPVPKSLRPLNAMPLTSES